MPRFINNYNKDLKSRILAVKEELPKAWRDRFYLKNPEYNNYKDVRLLENVITGNTIDEKVTNLLEKLVIEYQSENLKKEEAAGGRLCRKLI